MSFRRASFLRTALALTVLLPLLAVVCGQRSNSSSSSSSTGGASDYPFPYYAVYPTVPNAYPQSVMFDHSGRLLLQYNYNNHMAVAYTVGPKDGTLTLDALYPPGNFGTNGGSWSQAAVYRNTSSPQPLTVLLGPSNRNLIALTAQDSNTAQWLPVPGTSSGYVSQGVSYAGLVGSTSWSFNAVAVDQQLGLLYAAASPYSNAVFQFAITATQQQISLTQTVVITGANPLLYQPVGLAVDSNSLLYVADKSNRVVQFNSDGVQLAVLIGPHTPFVSRPQFTLDPSTGDFLTLGNASIVQRFSRDGTRQNSLQLPAPAAIYSIAVSGRGDLYMLEAWRGWIVVVPAAQAAPLSGSGSQNAGRAGAAVRSGWWLLAVVLAMSSWTVIAA